MSSSFDPNEVKFSFTPLTNRCERIGVKGTSVTADQALAFAQKAGVSMYVETSAKMSRKTVVAAFEFAATVADTFRRAQNQSSSTLGMLDILDFQVIAQVQFQLCILNQQSLSCRRHHQSQSPSRSRGSRLHPHLRRNRPPPTALWTARRPGWNRRLLSKCGTSSMTATPPKAVVSGRASASH